MVNAFAWIGALGIGAFATLSLAASAKVLTEVIVYMTLM